MFIHSILIKKKMWKKDDSVAEKLAYLEWIAILIRRRSRNLGKYCWILETNSLPQEITRDEIIFPYQEDMVHDTHTHVSSGKCGILVIFHLERKHSPLHSTYGGLPYSGKFELCSLYRIDSRKGREKRQGVASGYTSDKWWIGNKWGILTGNIRDIKKEPLTLFPPYLSRISRDWNLTLSYYPNWTKGTFDGDMECSRDTLAPLRFVSPFWEKKTQARLHVRQRYIPKI